MVKGGKSWLKVVIMVEISLNYHILLNKRTCLNKQAPNFWIYLAISQKPLNRSESNFQHLLLRYSRVHAVSFIEIW